MKMTGFILLMTCLQVSANGSAQVTFSGDNVHIEKVFDAIKKQTGYLFLYNSDAIAKAKPVTVHVKDETVEKVLELCVAGQAFGYSIKNKTIFIIPREERSSGGVQSIGESEVTPLIEVKGRVVNEKGEAVEGVSVRVKGSSSGTSTNANGEFVLKQVPDDGVLVFSAVNIQEVEWKVGGKEEMMVVVKTRVNQEQEVEVVVSTGYQDLPRERATGSFVKVDNELFNRKVGSDVFDRIYDVTSGLLFSPIHKINISDNKSPITIRGVSTILGNVRPLIVVDGFPYDESNGYAIVNDLNPNDIESVTVLKDAAAASIWGARAGNGVIVIKTKAGSYNQRVKFGLNSNLTIQEKPNLEYMQLMNSSQVIEVEKKLFEEGVYDAYDDIFANIDYFKIALPTVAELLLAGRRGQLTQSEVEGRIDKLKNKDVKNDIRRFLLQDEVAQQFALNFSGGSEKFNYYGSIGYDRNREAAIGNVKERLTLRLDNSFRPVKFIEFRQFITFVHSKTTNNGLNYYSFLPTGSGISPYTSFYDDDGNVAAIPYLYRTAYLDTARFPNLLDWRYRPLDELNYKDSKVLVYDFRIGASLSLKLTDWLQGEIKYQAQKSISNSTLNFGERSFYTRNLINQFKYRDAQSGLDTLPIPLGSIIDNGHGEQNNWNIRGQLALSKELGNSNLNIIAGAEYSQSNSDLKNERWYGFDPETRVYNTSINYQRSYELRGTGGEQAYITSLGGVYGGAITRLRSFYLNMAWNVKEKWTISLSGRQDAANLFGVNINDKFTPLWSAGISYELSNEKFYNLSWIPYLRFRVTYGYNGNLKTNATAYPVLLYSGFNTLTGYSWAQIISPPNPSLKWENVGISNFGVDFTLFNNRLSGSLEYYSKRGKNLISQIKIEPTTGWDAYIGNNASIRGRGWDITLNTKNVRGNVFQWLTTILFSHNANKVISYQSPPSVAGLLEGVDPYLNRQLYSIYAYRWGGLNATTGDPQGILADTISLYNTVIANTKPEDLIEVGSATPLYFGSLRNTLTFRNLSVSFNIAYRFKYFFRASSINYQNLFYGSGGHRDFSFRWQKPGDELNTYVPSMPSVAVSDRDRFFAFSEVLVERGDNIRIQDIQLSYVFENLNLWKIAVKCIKVYGFVNNVAILWRANSRNLDPEYNSSIPVSRSYSIGVKVDL